MTALLIIDTETGGLDDWLRLALEPKVEVVARVSYDDRQLAKDQGFGWDPARVEAFRSGLVFRSSVAS